MHKAEIIRDYREHLLKGEFALAESMEAAYPHLRVPFEEIQKAVFTEIALRARDY